MKRCYFIGVDVHCKFSEMAALGAAGTVVHRQRCATTIPALVAQLDAVPQPRRLVIDEGPLADWLWRHLRGHVAEMVALGSAGGGVPRESIDLPLAGVSSHE